MKPWTYDEMLRIVAQATGESTLVGLLQQGMANLPPAERADVQRRIAERRAELVAEREALLPPRKRQ